MKKIVLSAVVALVLIGCGDNNSTKQAAKSTTPQKASAVEKVAVVTKKVVPKEKKVIVREEKVTPKEITKPAVKSPKTVATAVDASKLFKVCSSCHGAKAEKKALGKSQVIAGWKSAKIVNALKGYKDGSYGGAMKAVMQSQAAKLNDADINALAAYISKL